MLNIDIVKFRHNVSPEGDSLWTDQILYGHLHSRLELLPRLSCKPNTQAEDLQTITVAGGCFWCVESDFESVDGVSEVISGYTGGTTENPDYREVTRGSSGHYEAVEIQFDRDQITERQICLLYTSPSPRD